MNTQNTTYSSRTVWIHWVTAVLIFSLIYSGITMEHSPLNENKFFLYRLHFSIGFIVFILTIIRIFVLFKDPKPTSLYPVKSTRERFRKLVYNGFYIVIIWMCISGILSLSIEGILPAILSGLLSDLPEIVFLLLIFHLGGFVSHLIQKKENTLKRIWFK